jgi:hypothetical protein
MDRRWRVFYRINRETYGLGRLVAAWDAAKLMWHTR